MEYWGGFIINMVLLVSVYFNVKNYRGSMNKKEVQMSKNVISNISHDLRTPLNAICGYSELIKLKFDLESEAIQYIDTITGSANLLLGLIDDILDESKINAGKMIIYKRPTNIKNLVREVEYYHELKAKEKNIDFVVNFSNRIDSENLCIDEIRIKQILNNLLSNAIKFTKNGGVYTTIKIEEDGMYILVEDTGIGIDQKNQKSIMKKYNQETTSTTLNFGGTGLGLSITTSLIKLMGGNLELMSQKGIGTTFKFMIPAKGECNDKKGKRRRLFRRIECKG